MDGLVMRHAGGGWQRRAGCGAAVRWMFARPAPVSAARAHQRLGQHEAHQPVHRISVCNQHGPWTRAGGSCRTFTGSFDVRQMFPFTPWMFLFRHPYDVLPMHTTLPHAGATHLRSNTQSHCHQRLMGARRWRTLRLDPTCSSACARSTSIHPTSSCAARTSM